MKEKRYGRPPKIIGKLSKVITLKLSEMDYANVQTQAENMNITPTEYARQMVISGYVRSPFSAEELSLMRKIAGIANNLNQYVKHLNSGELHHKLNVQAMIIQLKTILNDRTKS